MKKRLLSALLALALVFVLLPTTALAGVAKGSDYDISINGTNYVFSDSETCYFKSSFTSTEPSSPYLKLTKSSDTITVTVSGYVTVSDISVHNNFSTQDKINLIITGNKGSTLNIECKDTYGAALETYQSGDITIKGGIKVNANFSANNTNRNTDCHGISASKNLIITGKGTTVNAVNADHDAAAVKVGGNITVSDGAQLNATNKYYGSNNTDKAYAIKCGQLSISGDKTQVTAYTSNGKKAISGTVNNGDKLTFKAANSKGSQIFLQRPMDEALGYAYVEITQAPTDPYVLINGQYAIIGQETPIPGGTGTYLYKKTPHDGSFLTLKGVDITGTKDGPARFIQFGKNGGYYTIQLEGENKISGFSSGIVAPEDPGVNDVTVVLSGSGSLDITANQYAIDMQVGKLKFENTGTIKLTTGYNYYVNPLNALRVKTGNISIDNTKYDIVGARQEKNYPTETISDSSAFTPDLLNGYTVGEETTLFKTITITPAAAKDSTIRYNGTTLKQGETIKDGKGGTATVDRENNTITLDNFKGNYPLEFNAEFTPNSITLIGDSTLSAVETKYQNLTISGSGSLTVGSIRVPNNTQHTANLTITGGAHVTVNRPSEDKPAVEVSGNLTVTGEGTQLSAECTAATNPAIEVGGNVTISGNPGTNAYTVKAYNKYAAQRGRDDNLRPSQMPSAFEISGNLSISGSAQVMAQTDSDGAAVWMPAQKVISVADASLIAQNRSHNFSTISFGDESNMGNIYAKGQVNIVAENMLHSSSSLAHRAIKAYIYNHYNTGDSNPYYIKVVSEGVQSGGNVNVIPGHCTSTGGYKVTITRGDKVTRTPSPVVIAGTTLLNDTYYTITNGSTVAEGTENNYNAFYDSASKTLKLNNAQISHSFAHEDGGGTDGAIIFKEYKNYCIELSGENTISSMNTYAINGDTNSLTIKNAAGTENAKLTLTSNWMVICSIGGLNIQSDVTMVNTKEAGYLMYVNDTFSFDGYNAYASVNASGSPLVEYTVPTSGDKDAGYQYLRITKETLETGGGSTHQHTYDQSAWKSDATHHWQECTDPNCPDPTKGITNKASHSFSNGACTVCGYRDQTEEHHFSTDWTYDETHHWHACTDKGCTAISGKAPHEWTGWRIDEPSPGMHNRFCNCGYNDYSHHYNLVYAAAGEAGHYQYCTLGNCTFKTSTVPHNYDGDTCTICNYTKSGEIVPPTPDNPGTIVIIRPAEEEKPAQQPNPSTGANDLVGLAVAAAVAAALGSAALLRKHD